MKVLMLDNEYPPLGGGQGSEHYFLIKEFEKDQSKFENIKVDTITSSADKYYVERSNLGTTYYLNIGKRGKNAHFQSILDLIYYSIKALVFAIIKNKTEKYDLIVTWSGVPSGFLGYVVHCIQKTPYVVLLRGSDVPFYEKRWHFLDTWVFSWLSPLVWRNSARTFANSSGLRKQALKVDKKAKIEVVLNGIDTHFYSPAKNKKSDKTLIIMGVGRLIPRKGFNYLIESLGQIKEKNFELWLAGGGPEEKELKKLAKSLGLLDKIKFLGEVSRDKLSKLYKQIDLFCLPSLNEGMSNAILEAMASGIPIISTETPGTHELIIGKGTGFVVPVKDSVALRKKIEIMLDNPQLGKEMGKKGRKLVENLSFENIAKRYYNEFKEILK